MARTLLSTPPKARWGIPLVLPHGLLSLGLLIFAFASEQPAQPDSVRTKPEAAAATSAMAGDTAPHAVRRS